MVSGIAHELNQPLGAIVNYASAGRRLLAADARKADGDEASPGAASGPDGVPRLSAANYVIYGDSDALHEAAHNAGVEPFWWRVKRSAVASAHLDGQRTLLVDGAHPALKMKDDDLERARSERTHTRAGGAASYAWVEDAIADALRASGAQPAGGSHTGSLDFGAGIDTDGVVTAPISKKAWSMAGVKRFPGHTELFAERCAAKRARMMFVLDELRVILVTTHIPLSQVADTITLGRVSDTIDLAHEAMLTLGFENPRIAVAWINPHAGEDGLLGDDEQRVVTPAISLAKGQGRNVEGPLPGDTVFNAAVKGRYDIVVAMYHDQALAPVKLLGFDRAVNCTVGLPIVRTSPDHGVAYDIAGKNQANPGSMAAAIDLAIAMAKHRIARDTESAP